VCGSELGQLLRASASVDQLLDMAERQHAQLGASEVAVSLSTASHLSRDAVGPPLDDRRMRMLLERALGCLADDATPMDPQDLVDIARALAILRRRDALARSVWDSVQARGQSLGDAFSMRQISQLAWACSKAPVPTGELMGALATRAEARVGELTQARDITTLAYAFAKASVPASGLFVAIAAPAEQRMGTFNAQDLANTAWAFATAGVRAPGLFGALAVHAEQRMDTFTAQALANTAWAFATASVRASGLFAALAVHSGLRMGTFNAQDLANTAWAFATAGVRAPGLFAALAMHSEQRMAELYFENAQADESGQQIKCVSALELALLIYHSAQGSTPNPRLGRLRAAAHARSLAFNGGEAAVTSSASQLELSARLRAAGWEHADEACLEGGLLVVDMACTATRVVVEFDGPLHYFSHVRSGEESYDGSTLPKTKLLEALGWRVHRVGWRAWARDRDAEVARVAAALSLR
jgi:hypothetical protein